MKILYLDCSMGASGDMLLSSLSELLDDQGAFIGELNALGLPGVRAELELTQKRGVAGSHIKVSVGGLAEDGHGHNHGHGHGRSFASVAELLEGLKLSASVREKALAVYRLLAEAETKAHGRPVELGHFHELGALDAVCDIAGVCLLMEKLAPDRVVCSPLTLGGGTVRCDHGLLSVPAPAVAELVKGLPCYGDGTDGELLTPTGAALIKYFAGEFGPQPAMTVERCGVGLGTKDFERCNCLRAYLGEAFESCELRGGRAPRGGSALRAARPAGYPAPRESEIPISFGRVAELCCNLDDMTGEELGFAMEALFEAGALDAFYTPIQMKKNRPAYMLTVLCRPEDADALAARIFSNTTTLGVRRRLCDRYELQRETETVSTPYGEIRVKRGKPEYEDLARIARKTGRSLLEIERELGR
jgi:uncharacterized protein (TIGR00299 family) protein